MANERFYQGVYFDNLGLSLSSGVLTIHGALGRDLSSANPAYVVLPSKSTPGQFVKYIVTSNQTLNDATSGAGSDLTGNTFGTTASTAWSSNCPFFLYAVSNDNEDAISFAIARERDMIVTSSSANLGDPSTANADQQYSHFLFEDVTLTSYDSNPCICLGCINMTKDASDDWTITSLVASQHGFGRFQDSIHFTFPTGQNGASTGTHMIANGGTAPVFTNNDFRYEIIPGGSVHCYISLRGDAGTDGAGAVNAKIALPFQVEGVFGSSNVFTGGALINEPTNGTQASYFQLDFSNPATFITGVSGLVQNGDFTNGDRNIRGSCLYQPKFD